MYRRSRGRGSKFDKVFLSKRSFYYPNAQIVTNASGLAGVAGSVALSAGPTLCTGPVAVTMPSYSEYTALFDKYKILRYKITFIPRYNDATLSLAGMTAPVLNWVHDVDDDTVATNIDTLVQYPGMRSKVLLKPFSIVMKYPCVSPEVYNGVVSTGYGVKRSPWLNMAYPNIPHYGLKGMWSGAPQTTYYCDVRVTWYFACKNQR